MEIDGHKGKYMNYAPGPELSEKRKTSGKSKKQQDYLEKHYSTKTTDRRPSHYASIDSYEPPKRHGLASASNRPKCSGVMSNDDLYRIIQNDSSKCSRVKAPVDNARGSSKTIESVHRKYIDETLRITPEEEDEDDSSEPDEFGLKEKEFEDHEADDEVDEVDDDSEHDVSKLRHQNSSKGARAKTNHDDYKLSYEDDKYVPSKRFQRCDDDKDRNEYFDEESRIDNMQAKRSSWRGQTHYQDEKKNKEHKRIVHGIRACPECGQVIKNKTKTIAQKKAPPEIYDDSTHRRNRNDEFFYGVEELVEATSKMRCSKNPISVSKNRDFKHSFRSGQRRNSRIDTRYHD